MPASGPELASRGTVGPLSGLEVVDGVEDIKGDVADGESETALSGRWWKWLWEGRRAAKVERADGDSV
jgi:hypothetical protein